MMMDSNRALELLGDRSIWKIGLVVLVVTIRVPNSCWHMLAIVFVGMEPGHRCALPEGLTLNESVPAIIKDGYISSDKCNIWSNYSATSNKTTPCPNGWQYDPSVHSIINEWDLVCDKDYLVQMSQTIMMVGMMLGAMIMSTLTDRLGRKPVLVASLLSTSVLGVITSVVNGYITFAVTRFFSGIIQQGCILVGFTYSIELFPASQRTMAGMLGQSMWGVSMMLQAGIAWLTPNWRHFMLCISVPGIIAVILIWIMPESLPWLTARNRTVQAKHTLVTAAHISRVTLPEEFQLNQEDKAQWEKDAGLVNKFRESMTDCCRKNDKVSHDDKAAQYTIMDVVRSHKLLMFTLINAYIWCTNSMVYYGLSLSTGSLAGDPYLNFFLSGLVEVPAYIIAAFAMKHIGRRWSIFGFHIIAGIPLFLTLFIPARTADGTNLNAFIVTLSMIGKFGITGSFASIFLQGAELYPTTARTTCVGILSLSARIGAIIAPFSSYVAARVWWLPNIVFGVMAILAALMTLYLPETLNRPLPKTIEEVEGWSRTLSKEKNLRYKVEQKAMEVLKDSRANGMSESLMT